MLMPYFSPLIAISAYLMQGTGASKIFETGVANYTETDGSIAATSGVYDVTAQTTPTWGDLGWVADDVNAVAGKVFIFTLNGSSIESEQLYAGWSNNGLLLANIMAGIQIDGSGNVDVIENGVVTALGVSSVTNSTDEKFALIKGGYDANDVQMDIAANIATYPYGTSIYHKTGGYWKLIYRTRGVIDTGQDYPAMSFYDYSGTYDNLVVPGGDFAALLAPVVLDLFTDTDGTQMTAHTPDIDTEGGGYTNWAYNGAAGANTEVQSNKWATTLDNAGAVINTGLADLVQEASFEPSVGYINRCSVFFRSPANNNAWCFNLREDNNDLRLLEKAGGETTRDTAAVTINEGTKYRAFIVADGTQIECYFDDTTKLSWASTTYLNDTGSGITRNLSSDGLRLDNFAVWPRGVNDEYSALDI